MNAGPLAPLINDFAQNWATYQPSLTISIKGQELDVLEEHPLYAELHSLCSGKSASLPFFNSRNEVPWCTLGPNSEALRQVVNGLNTWLLPSFGGQKPGDGYVKPNTTKGGLSTKILAASPHGYYRWHCPRAKLPLILQRLRLQRTLESVRPSRIQPPRPSLYELRARFATCLLVGNRDGVEEVINLLDSLQLETAVNTQFMRVRMWHHFGEIDRIRDHPDLPLLLAQPLPPRVRAWIDEALGVVTQIASISISDSPTLEPVPSIDAVALVTTPSVQLTWSDWFDYVKSANKPAAEAFLLERPEIAIPDLSPSFIDALVTHLDEFYLDDALRARERALILQGLGEILHEYVRKPSFPRATLGSLYLTLFRLWGTLYAGTSIGQEHGHVLLELASAVLKLNLDPTLVRETLECWWQAKRSPSQIPFVLDAIELLERELPDTDAICNLWIDATDVIKRASDTLSTSERELWRRAGDHLGFDSETIAEYLPPDAELATEADPLAAINLNYVAIVCLREEQAEKAAKVIRERSGAQVDVITATTAGAETTHACHADVVIFVWMASTHAVFRAFDGFDRTRFCYVQGTGSSSIVRALERWTLYRL